VTARPITILLADDDADDRMLAEDALRESRLANRLYMVTDGEEVLEFLRQEGRHAGSQTPRPGVILLDLNMPRKDGREVLRELKSDPDLRQIPVIVLTTSKDEGDVFLSYDQGVNSYITKPVTFAGLVEVMNALGRYWFQLVELPPGTTSTIAGT
jgi:CheY-like chemotaxis protein